MVSVVSHWLFVWRMGLQPWTFKKSTRAFSPSPNGFIWYELGYIMVLLHWLCLVPGPILCRNRSHWLRMEPGLDTWKPLKYDWNTSLKTVFRTWKMGTQPILPCPCLSAVWKVLHKTIQPVPVTVPVWRQQVWINHYIHMRQFYELYGYLSEVFC